MAVHVAVHVTKSAPQVKHAHGAVRRDGGEDSEAAPGEVVHLLVVRDQLRVHLARLWHGKVATWSQGGLYQRRGVYRLSPTNTNLHHFYHCHLCHGVPVSPAQISLKQNLKQQKNTHELP